MSNTQSTDMQRKVQFFEDMGIATRPAKRLAEEFEAETDLVEYLTQDKSPTDLSGVGKASARHIRSWFTAEYPEKERERKIRSDAYCTEYTADHGVPRDELEKPEMVHWAWICPQCENKNVMRGDPEEFKNRPYTCMTCRWVPALDAETMEEWLENDGSTLQTDTEASQ